MQVTKLTKKNQYEEIIEQMKTMLMNGKLKAGDKLPSTKEMSERFGVGRSTMREALSALKVMGLIEIRQGGVCRVLTNVISDIEIPELENICMNWATLLEFLEARLSFEVSIASLAAEKRTVEDIKILEKLIQEMERSIGDDLEGERTDLLFHLALAKSTHNSVMVRLFESILNQLESAIRDIRRVELYSNKAIARKLFAEHSAIFNHIKEGNADAASQSMKQHLLHVANMIMKYS